MRRRCKVENKDAIAWASAVGGTASGDKCTARLSPGQYSFTSQALHEMLGEAGTLFGEQVVRRYDEATHSHMALTYDAGGAAGRWERASIPAGRQLPPPRTLFKKLEPELAEQELAALSRPL